MAPGPIDSPEAVAVDIVSEADLVSVRQVLRREADRAGLGLVDATKLITAGSELARNILTHAGGARGRLRIEQLLAGGRQGVQAPGPGTAREPEARRRDAGHLDTGIWYDGGDRQVGALNESPHRRQPIRAQEDVGELRRLVARTAADVPAIRPGEAALVATELATNIVKHGAVDR